MRSFKIYVEISAPIVSSTQLETRVQAMPHQAARPSSETWDKHYYAAGKALTAAPPNNGEREEIPL